MKNHLDSLNGLHKIEVPKYEKINVLWERTFMILRPPFFAALILVALILMFIPTFIALVRSDIALSSNDGYPSEHKYLRVINNLPNKERVVSCYYNIPNQHNPNELMPAGINPYLCTHVNVAFAQIRKKTVYLESEQYQSLGQIVLMKKTNPKLKILLSIGGARNDDGFSEMVVDHASRKLFIRSIKTILNNYSLDGVDLDWEFPDIHSESNERVDKRERQHFSQLLREIRMEFKREKKGYLLTAAVAAPETIVNTAYDVDQINMYVDYVNLMTYDFHAFSKYTPFTGLNSPLYHKKQEQMFLATLNVNYTVHMYLKKGLDRDKIVVGIPTYGHSFTLVNVDNSAVGSPATDYGTLGGLGFVNYPDICKFIKQFGSKVVVKMDPEAKVPYLNKGHEWVSYDTPLSAMIKANYVKEQNLRGAMIYSLNADDYVGICNQKVNGIQKFPLAMSIRNALLGEIGGSH